MGRLLQIDIPQKNKSNFSSVQKDFHGLAYAHYKLSFDEFFIGTEKEKNLAVNGCQFAFRSGVAYSSFLLNYMTSKKEEAFDALTEVLKYNVNSSNLKDDEKKQISFNQEYVNSLIKNLDQVK